MTNKTTATNLLQEGQDILKARAVLRDSDGGERSMARTVAIFNAWTDSNMSEEDGWRFMIALKQAREVQGDFHKDDYQDLVNYSALLGECTSCVGRVPEGTKAAQVPTPKPRHPVTDTELAALKEEAHREDDWVKEVLKAKAEPVAAPPKAHNYLGESWRQNLNVAAFFGRGKGE